VDGRECRRVRGVVGLTAGLLERGAKGLAVTERVGGGVWLRGGDDGDGGDGRRWCFDFTLVNASLSVLAVCTAGTRGRV
jgi:hypothetical protein